MMNERKIIQIIQIDSGYAMALCDDGTCWISVFDNYYQPLEEDEIPVRQYSWNRVKDVPQSRQGG